MARELRWWLAAVLLACGAVAVAYLPPRGAARQAGLGDAPIRQTPARLRAQALAGLAQDLAAFRGRLGGRPAVALHECEMLAHYVSGLLLPVFGVLARKAAPVHQALSDPNTYAFLWSLSPVLRGGSMYRAAVRMTAPGMADVPYALTNRPLRRPACRVPMRWRGISTKSSRR